MKNSNIRPIGRKGRETTNRIKELMNIIPIKESINRSTLGVTKLGPDGKAYAIVKENQEYYIKVSDKADNLGYVQAGLVAEDFKYIGGLKNKKSQSYHSYSEATKQLNMKFINLAETPEQKRFNILRSDGLNLSENTVIESDEDGSPVSVRYSGDRKGPSTSATDVDAGTVQTGNDDNQWITKTDKNGVNHWKKITEGEDINGKNVSVDKKTSGDNVAKGDNIGEDDFEKAKADGTKDGDTGTHAEKYVMEDVELTEDEAYIDEMLDPVGKEDCDIDNDGDHDESDEYLANKRDAVGKAMKNESISISKAMNEMDSIIDSVYGGGKEKVNDFLANLSEAEMKTLMSSLKKKA